MILENKTALITGAGGVIGGAIARAFAKEGARLLLSGRSLSVLEKIKNELKQKGMEAEIYAVDVSNVESVKKMADFATKHFEKLDVLVTAAGTYGEIGDISQCDDIKWLDAIKINLFGTFLSVKYCLPLFQNRGKIIAFSGGGEGPLPKFSSYASSKGGTIRLVETLSKELESSGIEINCVAPGLISSGFTESIIKAGAEKAGQKKYEDALREKSGEAPTESPEKAAALAVFLASGESNGLSGRNISAVWDNWKEIPKNIDIIKKSDIYTWRRIKSNDRGYEW